MTLVIQRAEHRDTQAIHAKLDEMLHALGEAQNELTRIDERSPRKSSNAVRVCDGMTDEYRNRCALRAQQGRPAYQVVRCNRSVASRKAPSR